MRRRLLAVVVTVGCGSGAVHHIGPDVELDSTPAALTNQTHSVFAFHPDGSASDFSCTVDTQTTDCTSPFAIDLTEGAHHFEVTASDGGPEGPAATFDWTIDTTAPDTTITSGPPALDNTTPEAIAFTGTDGTVSFNCTLDGSAVTPCVSPVSLAPGDGAHTFTVAAVDAAGNADPTPASQQWTLDTTLPDTTITAGPAEGSTSGPTVQFAFTGAQGAVAFDCETDGAAFAPCTSPLSLTLADGAHTFTVRAKDVNGVVDPSPAVRDWTVDATPPAVTIDSHPTDPSNQPIPQFTFSSPDPTATFACAIDSGSAAACTSPFAGASLVDGVHAFAVTATDAVGNASAPATFSWTIDTVPPVVTITGGPANGSTIATAATSFTFTTTGGAVAVTCSVDGGAATACTSPDALTGLADAAHTFEVLATDAAGNTGTASTGFTVDTTPPVVTITSAPTNPTNNPIATVGFTVTGATAVACEVDAGGFAACTSPVTTAKLADGSHTVTVRGTDEVGNIGTAAATFVVDTSAPTVTITSHPSNPSNSTSGTFAFTSNDPSSTLKCKLDGGAFAACSSPDTVTGLADGSHTFTVQATDTAGNAGTAAFTWTVDTTPPTVTFTASPPDPSNSSSGTFAFTTNDATATLTCAVDGGAFAACSSPRTVTGLADGSHTFTVHATDPAGNVGTGAKTWTIDTQAPVVTITTHPTNPTNQTSATFTFTSNDPAATLACKLDGGTFAACSSPDTLTGLADGSHTFTVQATDTAGNTGNASFTWVVDTTPPVVTITSGPANPTNSTSATFTFTSNDPAAALTCSLDSGTFAACSSPKTVTGLADGSHTFTVHATDTAGNVGSAAKTWTVDTTAPVVTITSHPTNPSNSASATFAFTTTDGTLQCKLDGGAFAACSSPDTLTGLADGSHTFTVQATDTAGNVGSASFTWTVDTTAPTVTITSGPANPSNSTSATFTFTSNDGTATLTCSLDGATFTACSSPKTVTGLADGSHTFTVHATDTAGNVGSASRTWTVDTTPPVVTITSHPTNPSNSASATFAFTASDGTLQCKVDGGAFAACSSPDTITGLADGSHTFTVQATDTAGNVGSAAFTWTIDTVPPTVTFTSTPANPSNSASATFAFTSNDGTATLTCSLDGATFTACASPKALTGLADGSHTFTVHATDAAGNVGSAAFTWTIDTTPPVLVLDDAPPAQWPVNYYDILFHSPESGVKFTCSLNGAAFTTCASPDTIKTTYGITSTFVVRAADALGNTSQQSATWTSNTGLVLHYPYELGSSANTSLLVQRPSYSPNGTLTTADGGGWAGAASVNPLADTYKGTVRPLTSSPNSSYTASVWVLPQTNGLGTIMSNMNAGLTGGFRLNIRDGSLVLQVAENGGVFNTGATLVVGRWSNVAIESTSPDKGVNLFVDGNLVGTATPPTNIGFDATQTDLVVGAVTNNFAMDDVRFYNEALDTTDLCTDVEHGTISPASGQCVALLPTIDLRFDDGTADDAGTAGIATTLQLTAAFADTLGNGVTNQKGGILTMGGFTKNVSPTSEHSLALFFESKVSDVLWDDTTQCSALAVTKCGITVSFDAAANQVVVFGGTTGAQQTVDIDAGKTFSFHSVVVTEQHAAIAGATVTQQLTVFVDGKPTIIPIGSGNIFQIVNDTITGPRAQGTTYDEYRFYLRDLTEDDEMLCENGFFGQYDHLDDSCSLVNNE
jgi:hypothetical protein|nr:Ig-like domain-containing protein [Kofleriaceae bacterium]